MVSKLFIYEISGRIDIWEAAALIIDIDPADVLEEPRRITENPTYGIGEILEDMDAMPYLYPEKDNHLYKKTMTVLISEALKQSSDFDADDYYNENCQPPPYSIEGGWNICEASTVDVKALKKWALSNGFQSEFLGNVESLEPKEQKSDEQKQDAPESKLNQELEPVLTAKGLNIHETREQAFKFWVAGKGGEDVVQSVKKGDVWDDLNKICPKLFTSGKDDFFKEQKIVKFLSGRKPASP